MMPNHLSHENSPYLLQHASNPVDWYPWNDEALNRARDENKPIFLSIGYAACHWCHVMAHESFEDEAIAEVLNRNFISIKVDREERLDLDSIYMNAVVALTGQGGWPMSVFLTPDGKPFFGGTYYPPQRRGQLPSFREILNAVHDAWQNQRERMAASGDQLTEHINQSISLRGEPGSIQAATLENASHRLAEDYDWEHGGWGRAPKFPQPMTIDFLLRMASNGDQLSLFIAKHALQAMAKGGMYDVVGGGFARYSTDTDWRVPHFEKMLYDNGLLAQTYVHAYLLTGDDDFRRVCEETLQFIARELTSPEGGFFSSLDADSDGEEGVFYLWRVSEIERILGPERTPVFFAAYGISDAGDFDGSNVLHRVSDDKKLAKSFGIDTESLPAFFAGCHHDLLEARDSRNRPKTDDKILVSWNALAMVAFAEAGMYLNIPQYITMATRNADFILSYLFDGRQLMRSWRNGSALQPAFLEDYASLGLGLLTLYQADPQPRWFNTARLLAEIILSEFPDPAGGFYDTSNGQTGLIIRPKDIQDNATPSGNALAASLLLKLAAFTNNKELQAQAESILGAVQDRAQRFPTAFGLWLCAIHAAKNGLTELAILGDLKDRDSISLLRTVFTSFRPNLVLARSGLPVPPGSPELLRDRDLLQNKPTAYLCHSFVCKQPVNDPGELTELLAQEG